jgi:Fe-S-cluster formation regulator IscX/YfhJ
MSIPKVPNDRINIILESSTADVIPQAFQDLDHYICNLPEFREEIERINKKIDIQLEGLIEAKNINRIFLDQIKDLIKKRTISFIGINPADLIKKDVDLSLEIMKLQQEKEIGGKRGSLGPILITLQPSNSTIKQNLIFTAIVSLITAIFVVFLLEYLDRMKTRERND